MASRELYLVASRSTRPRLRRRDMRPTALDFWSFVASIERFSSTDFTAGFGFSGLVSLSSNFSELIMFSRPGLFFSFFSSSDNCFSPRGRRCLGFLEGLFVEILFLFKPLLFSFTDWVEPKSLDDLLVGNEFCGVMTFPDCPSTDCFWFSGLAAIATLLLFL